MATVEINEIEPFTVKHPGQRCHIHLPRAVYSECAQLAISFSNILFNSVFKPSARMAPQHNAMALGRHKALEIRYHLLHTRSTHRTLTCVVELQFLPPRRCNLNQFRVAMIGMMIHYQTVRTKGTGFGGRVHLF